MLEFRERTYRSGKSRPSYAFCRKAPGDFKRGMIFTLCTGWFLLSRRQWFYGGVFVHMLLNNEMGFD